MKKFWKQYCVPDRFAELIAGLTVFLLIFHSFHPDVYELVLMIFVPILFWNRCWLTSPWLWMIFGVFAIYSVFSDYIGTDNHKWLYMYWIWALVIAFFHKDPKEQQGIITLNARFFLIASMGFSVFWKSISPHGEFHSGAFMEYTFLSDDRFAPLLGWIGIPQEMFRTWYDLTLDFQFQNGFQQVFDVPKKVALLATMTTWYALLSEAAVAFFFLFRTRTMDILGHISLVIFVLTTYLIAPVHAFGTILCILGLSLAMARFPKTILPYCYLFCLIVIAFYDYFF